MSGELKEVLARRARLVARAAVERDEFARLAGAWQKPLAVVDGGLAVIRMLSAGARAVGVGLGIVLAALAIVRPRNLNAWLWGGVTVWRLAQTVGRRLRG